MSETCACHGKPDFLCPDELAEREERFEAMVQNASVPPPTWNPVTLIRRWWKEGRDA